MSQADSGLSISIVVVVYDDISNILMGIADIQGRRGMGEEEVTSGG
jgi:hypothetical protein